MEALIGQGVTPDVHLFTRADDGFDLRARMFAPLDGVPEDPATGSANCALAGMLALRHALRFAASGKTWLPKSPPTGRFN